MTGLSCPHCSIGLSEGYVLDRTRNGRLVSQWVEGRPERSFWTGLKLGNRGVYPISAYRCPRCGYLAFYAPAAGS